MLLGFSSCHGGEAVFASKIKDSFGLSGDYEFRSLEKYQTTKGFSEKIFYSEFRSFYSSISYRLYGLLKVKYVCALCNRC